MIVYPGGLIASELAAGRPLTRPRIGYQTYTRDAGVVVTASTDTVPNPKDAALRPDTAEYWQPTALPAEWKLDFLTSKSIAYVGIAAHTYGSAGCVITVATSPDNSVWTTWGAAHTPTDDSPILILDTPRNARYLRVSITGASVMPKMAVIYFGPVLTVERPIWGGYRPINMNRETVLTNQLSRGGAFIGQSYRRGGVRGDIPLKFLSSAWYRANFDPFVKTARQFPFFLATRPETYTTDVVYAWVPDDVSPTYSGEADYIDVTLKLFGVGFE